MTQTPSKQQVSSNWLNDTYEGDYKQGWYHGNGKLTMQNGVVYEGQFVKGHFHGQGKLIYPNGGVYKAKWNEGKMLDAEYYFQDNLQFESKDWPHCTSQDRRYYAEVLQGIKPSGSTQQTREKNPHNIPAGTYDTGDGYYQPVKSVIYSFDGNILRTPSQQQVKFIISKCRFVPRLVDIHGEKDRVIKKVLEKENQIQAQ